MKQVINKLICDRCGYERIVTPDDIIDTLTLKIESDKPINNLTMDLCSGCYLEVIKCLKKPR